MLFSGGLDSTTVLAIARDAGFEPVALTVRYGQRHEAELRAAARIAASAGVEHRVVSVDLGAVGGSALTDASIAVPKDRSEGEMTADIPVTYVPARNTVLLSLALGIAEVTGSSDVFVGVNAVDYSGYPDCRPEFVEAFERLANVATKAAVEGRPLRIHAPLISDTKEEIIRKGLALGVDYGQTHSCYDPGPDDRACGRCDACAIRREAFGRLGMTDPVLIRNTETAK